MISLQSKGLSRGTEGYIRLSYCYSEEELKRGLDRLEVFVKEMRERI